MTQALWVALLFVRVASTTPDRTESIVACDSTRLAAVASMRGTWHVRSVDSGATPPLERTGTANVAVIAGGCALRQDLQLGSDYHETRILAFDERGGAWQLVIVDSDHGNIVSLRGHEVTNGLDFISTHQRADRLLIDRVSIRSTPSGWLMRTETASGYGAPWRLLQEITYSRPA
jgi:hypothetical protein